MANALRVGDHLLDRLAVRSELAKPATTRAPQEAMR
jgi:hypothetical protein